jgi:CRP/FNR family transcriptional regulator, cyclic AMP receptor protein
MINVNEIIKFIDRVPLFQGLNSRQKEHLAKRFVERKYKAGDEILSQGKGGEGFFILIEGHANAFRTRSDGTQLKVNEFGATDFFGELALLDDGIRTATVSAVDDTTCLILTRWEFLGLLREDAEMAVSILQEMAHRFRTVLDTM